MCEFELYAHPQICKSPYKDFSSQLVHAKSKGTWPRRFRALVRRGNFTVLELLNSPTWSILLYRAWRSYVSIPQAAAAVGFGHAITSSVCVSMHHDVGHTPALEASRMRCAFHTCTLVNVRHGGLRDASSMHRLNARHPIPSTQPPTSAVADKAACNCRFRCRPPGAVLTSAVSNPASHTKTL